jgi:hypothetical protein
VSDEYRQKLRSLNFGRPSVREQPNVTRYDRKDTEAEDATVTEHWDGRVDVAITAPSVNVDMNVGDI